MKILAICPSMGRPKLFRRMVDSFSKTKSLNTHLIASFDDEDVELENYLDICAEYHVNSLSSFGDNVTHHFNNAFQAFRDYDYFHMTNDDVIYKTEGWDKTLTDVLIEKPGISYGDDGFQGQNLPTFPMISGDIVRAVGYLQMTLLHKFSGDDVWREIGSMARCLYYVPEVKIEHHHFINGKRDNDDKEYQKTYNHDRMMFANWLANYSIKDIRHVRKVVHGNQNLQVS